MQISAKKFLSSLLVLFLALSVTFAGCGKATRDSAESRYRSARDHFQALGAKNPSMKITVDQMLANFDKDFEIAMAKQKDEEAISAIAEVSSRMEKQEAELVKSIPAPGAVPGAMPAPGGVPVAPGAMPAAPGGKLGGGAVPPPAGVPAPGGMPGAGMPGGAMPGGAMPGGKLGGGAPPAAPPAPAQGGSGFGGQ